MSTKKREVKKHEMTVGDKVKASRSGHTSANMRVEKEDLGVITEEQKGSSGITYKVLWDTGSSGWYYVDQLNLSHGKVIVEEDD
jgi:hypothetical protein